MLYVIQHGYNGVKPVDPSEIVYCLSDVKQILDLGLPFVYFDGHATDRLSRWYTEDDVDRIGSHVDFEATRARYWTDQKDLDLKRRKEAEFLLGSDLPTNAIKKYIVYNVAARKTLIGHDVPQELILTKAAYYF